MGLILVYDDNCDFCIRSVRFLKHLDRQARIDPVPCNDGKSIEILGLTTHQCREAAWAIDEQGRQYRGAGAVIAGAAFALGFPAILYLYSLPGVQFLAEGLYRGVSRVRHLPVCGRHVTCRKPRRAVE